MLTILNVMIPVHSERNITKKDLRSSPQPRRENIEREPLLEIKTRRSSLPLTFYDSCNNGRSIMEKDL